MAATFSEIITDCVQQALGLPRDQLEVELRDLALSAMNEQGRIIWDSWPWDNEKLDEFDSPTPDADGIITFAANVDVVRALRSLDSSSSSICRQTRTGTGGSRCRSRRHTPLTACWH